MKNTKVDVAACYAPIRYQLAEPSIAWLAPAKKENCQPLPLTKQQVQPNQQARLAPFVQQGLKALNNLFSGCRLHLLQAGRRMHQVWLGLKR